MVGLRHRDVRVVQPILPVRELAAAADLHRALGFDVQVWDGGRGYASAP